MRGKVLAVSLAGVLSSACVSRRTTADPRAMNGAAAAAGVERVVYAALEADAAGDPSADTLYAPGATVVANARERLHAPRLAGVGPGGRITVSGSEATREGRLAWVTVSYRWISVETGDTAAGRASFVCYLAEGRWTIVHLHSSQPLPWEG